MYEQSIYDPYDCSINPYLDEARTRRKSSQERLKEATEEQRRSGVRIMIDRPIVNYMDFKNELIVWEEYRYKGVKRRSLGALHMTIFDTKQQPLRSCTDSSQFDLEQKLEDRCPDLFQPTPPIEVAGIKQFGRKEAPFIVLTFLPSIVYAQRIIVAHTVAPELQLGDSHQRENQPHVTLGQIMSDQEASNIVHDLIGCIPKYVQFGPARVNVEALYPVSNS